MLLLGEQAVKMCSVTQCFIDGEHDRHGRGSKSRHSVVSLKKTIFSACDLSIKRITRDDVYIRTSQPTAHKRSFYHTFN